MEGRKGNMREGVETKCRRERDRSASLEVKGKDRQQDSRWRAELALVACMNQCVMTRRTDDGQGERMQGTLPANRVEADLVTRGSEPYYILHVATEGRVECELIGQVVHRLAV